MDLEATELRKTGAQLGADVTTDLDRRAASGALEAYLPRSAYVPRPALIAAGIALLCLIWGSTWFVISQGLRDLPPLSSAAARFGLSSLVFALLARPLARREGGARPTWRLTLVYGVLTLAIPYGIIYTVETRLPSGLVSVLWTVYPLLLAAVAAFLLPEERLGARRWLGLFGGFAGVVLLFLTEVASTGPGAVPMAALLLFSPLSSAFGNALIKLHGKQTSSVLLNRNGVMLGCALLLLAALTFEHDAPVRWSPQAIGSLLYLSLLGTVVAFLIYFWLLRYARATRMSLLVYGVPVVAVTLGATAGGESLGWMTVLGLAAILSGVALVLAPHKRPG